jgi:hypothetical protein
MQQLAKEREEERKRFELENEKKLVELLNEINSQLLNENEALAETTADTDGLTIEISEKEYSETPTNEDDRATKNLDYPSETNFEDDLDLINEDDELLKKILNHRHLNALGAGTDEKDLTSPLTSPSNDDIINLFNIVDGNCSNHNKKHSERGKSSRKDTETTDNAEEDEFQLVENDLNVTPIKESDLNVNVFRSTPKNDDILNEHDSSNKSGMADKTEKRKYKGKNILEEINAAQKSEAELQNSETVKSDKLEENNSQSLLQLTVEKDIVDFTSSLIDLVVQLINNEGSNFSQFINGESRLILNSNNQSSREENSSNSIEVLAKYSESDSFNGSQTSASTAATTLSPCSSVTSSNCSQSTSVNDSSIEVMPAGSDVAPNDEEDSDIEVIVSTTKKNKKKQHDIEQVLNQKLDEDQQEKSNPMVAIFDLSSKSTSQIGILTKESALLTSITEKELDSLLVNKNQQQFQLALSRTVIKDTHYTQKTQSQIDDDGFMLNYDLINEHSSPLNSFDSISEPIEGSQLESCAKEKLNNQCSSNKTFQKSLVDYSLNSTEDS